MPNEIPAVFDDGLNYDYHFIIKELSNEFEFECLEENTKNYQTFFVPLEIEVTKINKDGNESVVTISYTIKFINNAKVMQVHYQILLIISRKEFIKLHVKLKTVFLNMKMLKTIWYNIYVYLAIKTNQTTKWIKN